MDSLRQFLTVLEFTHQITSSKDERRQKQVKQLQYEQQE